MRDWELWAARMGAQPNNARFARPTRRTLDEAPVIERFDLRDSAGGAALGIIGAVIAIIAVFVS